jgi:hypothetical protein
MKRTAITVAPVLAFFVAGCGRYSANLQDSGSPAPPGESATGGFSLRLAGVDKGDFVSARMRINSVQVSGGGTVLANTLKTAEVDLTETGQAYLLASFQPPAGLEDVEFAVSFEGGTVSTQTASFTVDSTCQTLRLAGKVSKIAERKHAVIHLDVARSFVKSSAGLMLVPHFQLVY